MRTPKPNEILTSTVIQGTLKTCEGGLSPGTYLSQKTNN